MKQSAVEWFYNELKELIKQSELTEMKPSEFDDRETKLLEQAKEMEDENMINFLKSVFQQDGFDYKKALEQFKNI